METLYGLSIQQPWIDMIVRGIKTIEIRSWKVKRRGIIALHTPSKIDLNAAYFYGFHNPWELPRGKILALAEITDVIQMDESNILDLLEKHYQPLPIEPGSFGILLENIQILRRPVACKGRPMFFPLPEKIAGMVQKEVQ